jgi:hypothetical protein
VTAAQETPPAMGLRRALPAALDRRRGTPAALADVLSLVPGILAAESAALPTSARGALITDARVTSTGRAVVTLSPPKSPATMVLTAPTGARALAGHRRESSSLAALHEDKRLAEWRRYLPKPLATGTRLDHEYRLDACLPGRLMLRWLGDPSRTWWLVERAAQAVEVLHERTAAEVVCDQALVGRWVDARIDVVARLPLGRRRVALLERLRVELRSALAGSTVNTSWIHGDYWPGNILAAVDEPVLLGIVDWDAASPDELPLHDVLHLLLYTERLQSRRELGQVVVEHLRAPWSAPQRRLLERQPWRHTEAPSERHALLLYWLRAVAFNVDQQGESVASYRLRYWQRRNVDTVLAAL